MTDGQSLGRRDGTPSPVALSLAALGVLVVFLLAVRLLGTATEQAAPALAGLLGRVLVGDASALGLGWIAAYALGNGSVVAAVSLSLLTSELVSPDQLYLLVAGSRLGGAAIVVFVGALDSLGKRRYSLRKGVSLGVLTFLVTYSVYVPATVVGYVALPAVRASVPAAGVARPLPAGPLALLSPFAESITASLGPLATVAVAVLALFGSLRAFDRLLSAVETASVRDRLFRHFQRPWLSFGAGLLVTAATTSVAFSLGVVVPLYNRGYVERDELVPYVLGANVGTLVDTLVVALVLGSRDGVVAVLTLAGVAVAVTLLALATGDRYLAAIGRADDRQLGDRRAFLAFAAVLVGLPLALVGLPLGLT